MGRTIIAYYAVQLVPPLALGAAYFQPRKIPSGLASIIMTTAAMWFVIFNPTHIAFLFNSPQISEG